MKFTKMKILHLYTDLNIASGITRVIRNIISMGDVYGAENHIAVIGGDAVSSFTAQKINIKLLKYGKNKIFFFPLCFEVLNYCRKNKIEIIHSHHRYMDLAAAFAGIFSQIKLVATAHSIVKGYKLLSFKTKRIVAVSETVRHYLIEQFNVSEEKIKVINNAVNIDENRHRRTDSEIKNELKIGKEKKIILYPGRFDYDKGIDILLNTIKKLAGKRTDFVALLIGNGSQTSWIYKYVQDNRLPVILLEPCLNIYDYYQIADIIALPSRVDTFPYPMLEAGIMHKAFIGTNVYGIGEFIHDKIDGLLVESLNIAELASGIEVLMDDNILRNSIAEKLYIRVKQNFLAEHKIPLYYDLYKDMLNL